MVKYWLTWLKHWLGVVGYEQRSAQSRSPDIEKSPLSRPPPSPRPKLSRLKFEWTGISRRLGERIPVIMGSSPELSP